MALNSHMSTVKPLTEGQRNAWPGLRAWLANLTIPMGTAESLEERARQPEPGSLPADMTVRIEISPPSTHPHPLLENNALKTPEPVPLYFYALKSDSENQAQPESDPGNTRVIFCIHGGGNVTGHPTHAPFMNLFAELLRSVASHSLARAADGIVPAKSKCVVIAPSYRLATVPENAFPAALQDLVAAYEYVLGKGYDASNIVIAGDSAGGNHAVVLTHLIQHSGRPLPMGVVAIAPVAMQVCDLSEEAKVRGEADILNFDTVDKMTQAYVGDLRAETKNPLVSAAFLTFTPSWPKTLILIGTVDVLIDGSRELARQIAAGGAPVELVEYDGRPHGWWVLPHIFPEDLQDATKRVARFLLETQS